MLPQLIEQRIFGWLPTISATYGVGTSSSVCTGSVSTQHVTHVITRWRKRPASTVYQQASTVYQPASTVYQPASTFYQPASTVYQAASTIYSVHTSTAWSVSYLTVGPTNVPDYQTATVTITDYQSFVSFLS